MRKKGFTLIESLVVLTIILILLSAISLSVVGVVSQQQEEIIKNELCLLASAGKQYYYRHPEEGELAQRKLVEAGILARELVAKKGQYRLEIRNKMALAYLEDGKGNVMVMRDGAHAKATM